MFPAPSAAREPGTALDASAFWRRRPLFWLALAFCVGIATDDAWQPGLPTLGGGVLTASLAGVAALLFITRETLRPRACLVVALSAGFSGGALVHALNARFLPAEDVSRRTPATPALAWLEGTLCEVHRAAPEASHEFWTLDLTGLGPVPEELTPCSGTVQLSIRKDAATPRGAEADRVRLLARLEPPAGATLPDGADFGATLVRRGVRRVGEATSVHVIGTASWWRVDLRFRRWSAVLAERNVARLGSERAALLNALVLGRREGLDASDREAFARTGTAHLLAISGLNLHFLAWLASWGFLRLGWSKRRAGLTVFVLALGYTLLVGAQPPVVRALVLIGLYTLAHVLRRAPDPLSSLAAAGVLMLFFAPGELFLPGFQLTFLAVLALVTLLPALENSWQVWRGVPESWIVDADERRRVALTTGVRNACFVSLAAWAGTAPAVAWHMGYYTLPSLATNLLAVPLSSLGMVFGGLGMLPGLESLAWLLHVPLDLLVGLNRVVAAWPWANLDVAAPSVPLLIAYAFMLACIWLVRGPQATLSRVALALVTAFAALALATLFRATPDASRLTVLDLSRGRAALVETPSGEAALIDAGGAGQGARIAGLLRRAGISKLQLLVLTEDDPEALGGAKELLRRIAVSRAVLPRAGAPSFALRDLTADLERAGIPHGPAEFSSALRGPGDVRWEFASDAPPERVPGAGSEALAVRVSLGGTKVCFVRARSSASVRRLLAAYAARLDAQVLRLLPSSGGQWPAETARLVELSGARTVIAGQGASPPEEASGMDLEALAEKLEFRLISPARDGSLRMNAADPFALEQYRGGQWEHLASWP